MKDLKELRFCPFCGSFMEFIFQPSGRKGKVCTNHGEKSIHFGIWDRDHAERKSQIEGNFFIWRESWGWMGEEKNLEEFLRIAKLEAFQ